MDGLEEKIPSSYSKIAVDLPKRSTPHDYPVTLTGHLTNAPEMSVFGRDKHAKAKFRLLVVRNVYPLVCVAHFQQAEQIAKLGKGANLLVGGIMRHFDAPEKAGVFRNGILQVSNIIIMPDGYAGLDLGEFLEKMRKTEERVAELEQEILLIKDKMDSYGIKVEKKRDWREGAEPGSLW